MNSKQIEKLRMQKAVEIADHLGCPYEEAYQVVLDDEEVDKMTSLKQIEDNLTEEQKKISKEMRSTTSGKKQTRKPRSMVIDVNKRDIFTVIKNSLDDAIATPTVLKDDKELMVHYGGKDYKVTISTPRVKKEEA